ncbi:MAG: TonB-dependent receptor [Candidatus Hydrogenedentota bacterium]
MSKVTVLFIFCLTFIFHPTIVFSYNEDTKPEVYELEEIVVTATRTEKPVRESPASVTVITSDDISRINVKSVDQVVGLTPGVFNKRTKPQDIMPTINIRGLYGYNRNLILVDGVPVIDWRRIPITMEQIDRIEVVRGPYSVLYGDNAMGGVVNIITKIPEDKLKVHLSTGYESYNTRLLDGGLSGKKDRLGFFLSTRLRKIDGYINNFYTVSATNAAGNVESVTGWIKTQDSSGAEKYLVGDVGDNYYEDEAYNVKLSYDMSDITQLTLSYIYTDYEYGYRNGHTYLKRISDGADEWGDTTAYINDNGTVKKITIYDEYFTSTYGGCPTHLYNLTLKRDISIRGPWTVDSGLKRGDIKLSLGYGKQFYWFAYNSTSTDYVMENPQWIYLVDIQTDLRLNKRHFLTFGGNWRRDELDSEKWNLNDWKNLDSKTEVSDNYKGKSKLYGLFLLDEFILNKKTTVYLGARYDDWETYDGFQKYLKSGAYLQKSFTSRTEHDISPRLSLVYTPSNNLIFRASYGSAFNTPSCYDLYKRTFYTTYAICGNPDLEPEKVRAFDIGTEWQPGVNTTVKLSYFDNRMKDYIYTRQMTSSEVTAINADYGTSYDTVNVNAKMTKKDNIGKAESSGFELEIEQKLGKNLTLSGNYTQTKTKVTSNPYNTGIVGKQLPCIPEVSYNLMLDYNTSRFGCCTVYRYRDKIYYEDDNSDVVSGVFGAYDKISVVDAKLWYVPIPNVKVSLSCDNIADKEYYEYYKQSGRTWGVNVETTF